MEGSAHTALIERQRQLQHVIGQRRSRSLYLDHVENDGWLLFEEFVKMDLKNPRYSHAEGR